MPKVKELQEADRWRAVYLKECGLSNRKIGKELNISHEGVRKILLKVKNYGEVQNLKRKGRKRLTDQRTDRQILAEVRNNQQTTAIQIKNKLDLELSNSTIRRLYEAGLHGRISRTPCITQVNQAKRLAFALKFRKMDLNFWNKVIWSDESKFELFGSKRKKTVWRKDGDAFKLGCTQPTVKHSKYIMIWGCFSGHGMGQLTEVSGRMDAVMYRDILDTHLISSAVQIGIESDYIFQHDNDPKHTSKLVKSFLSEKGINVLEWPPQSPDLNPIEHMWDQLDREISINRRKSFQDFKEALFERWYLITPKIIQKLVQSMPSRLEAVIAAKGAATKY